MDASQCRCVRGRAVGVVRVAAWLLAAGLLWLGNTAKAQPTEGYLPQFTRTVSPARAARVPLRLDFPQDLALAEWPVTFGVPFPRGALASAENLRIVDGTGKTVPAQVLRTATWQKSDGDVKWVLVDMSARQGTTYAVEYGTAVSRTPVESPLTVADAGDDITVTTGPLRVAFSRRESFLMKDAWLDSNSDGRFGDLERTLQARRRMSVVDQDGKRCPTSDRPEDYKLEVETRGPLRVVIKATGSYRDEAGTSLLDYVTRVHLYAGQPFVRIIHTFVVTFDTDKTYLRDVAVPFDVPEAGTAAATFQVGTGVAAATKKVSLPARLVQDSTNHFSLTDGQGNLLHEGQRVGGWVDRSNSRGGVAVALRNMWQDHQKELEANADGVVAHLWPAHSGRPLDFRAPAVLGPERYKRLDGVYWRNWYEGGLDKYDQAMGLAKTNELIVAFHGPDARAARAACAAQEQPPFVVADPGWMCKTDVFGPLHPHDPERFPDIEKKFEIAFGRYEFLREHLDNYGFFDYGDVNYVVSQDENKHWVERPWRRMASRFYGISLLPWSLFARSGERRYLEWAIDNAKHVMDIDMTHVTAKVPGYPYPKWKGGRFGGNGGIIHYGSNVYDIGCDSHVTPWLYYYYLTGYRRAWDVFHEEGEFYLKLNKPDFLKSGHLLRYAHRMTGGSLRLLIQYWWATWDERYLELAHTLAGQCYDAAAKTDGVIRHDDVYMNPGLVTYYQATGDERMKAIILKNMRAVQSGRMVMADERAYTFYGPSMAYYFTGDASYLARPLAWLRQYQEELNTGDDPLWRGVPEGRWDMCHNCVHLLYAPYLLAALTTLDQPIEPAPPMELSASRSEIWLRNPDGRALDIPVEWICYKRPYFIGVSMPRWAAHCRRVKPTAGLSLLDPAGKTVASAPIQFETDAHAGTVNLRVPAAPAGMYRLVLDNAESMPLKIRLGNSVPLQWVYPLDGNAINRGTDLYVRTPEDSDTFTVRYKVLALRVVIEVSVLNSQGDVVAVKKHKIGSNPLGTWVVHKLPVSKAERAKLWHVKMRPAGGDNQEMLLRVDGTVPVASTTPEAFFVPEQLPERRAPARAPTPPGVVEPVQTIPAGKTLSIANGAKTGETSYETVDTIRGTLEFWLRPDWDPDDISDGNILTWGQMRLYRRSQIGTYLKLGTTYLQSGYWLKPGVWNHVAVVWDFEAKRDKAWIYINGTQFGTPFRGRRGKLLDWPGKELVIGGNAPFHITGLRIWNRDRRAQLGKGILSPPPDKSTLFPVR
jgi:hypothetical protein